MPTVALSTMSAFPESAGVAFELAARLGYDGVEVMVTSTDASTTDPDKLERLRDQFSMPVVAVHAPTLLVSQGTWGSDPWVKLERSARAANQLGASIVVVHPPFRWQSDYAARFVEGLTRLVEETGIRFCVENMYPWRTPMGEFKAYLPGWDPTDLAWPDLALDLSHASTAKRSALDYVRAWGGRLRHVHLTDGVGSVTDDHLLAGYGDQRAAEVLAELRGLGFAGHVVIEVNMRRAASRAIKEADLGDALAFARAHLGLADQSRPLAT